MGYRRAQLLLWPTILLAAWLAGCGRAKAPAQADLDTAWRWYAQGDFELALGVFAAVQTQAAPDSPEWLHACYGQAVTCDLRRPDQDAARAEALYREVIAKAPQSDLAAWSWLALARMKALLPPGQEPPRAELLQAYQDVVDRFPHHAAGEEAFLCQQAARLQPPSETELAAVDQAVRGFLAERPQSPYRFVAWRLVALCAELRSRPDEQLAAVLAEWEAAEHAPGEGTGDLSWVYWRIATIAEFEVGDFATAREYYQRLLTEYPTEQRCFLARQELKRMAELEDRLRRELAAAPGGPTP
jgi:tetratricopeptide (TPR) repeat protein